MKLDLNYLNRFSKIEINEDVIFDKSFYEKTEIRELKNIHVSGLVEIDLMGKIYYEYSMPGGYHHDVYEMDNGNLLVASNDFEDGTVEDYIVLINRENGNIIKSWDLKDILPTTYGLNEMATDYDWFHNNSVWYDKNTNSITLSGRHQDAVINIEMTGPSVH